MVVEIIDYTPAVLVSGPCFSANKLWFLATAYFFELKLRYLLVFCLSRPMNPHFFFSYKFLSFYMSQQYDCQNILVNIFY